MTISGTVTSGTVTSGTLVVNISGTQNINLKSLSLQAIINGQSINWTTQDLSDGIDALNITVDSKGNVTVNIGHTAPPISTVNKDLATKAIAELKQTTVGYKNNKIWTIPPPGSHWANAMNYLKQIF